MPPRVPCSTRGHVAQLPVVAGEQPEALAQHRRGQRSGHHQVDVQVLLLAADDRMGVGCAEHRVDPVRVVLARAPVLEQCVVAQRVLQFGGERLRAAGAERERGVAAARVGGIGQLM